MQPGYLTIETNEERPGMVRLYVCDAQPHVDVDATSSTRIRHIARFNDSEAALMHTHEILKRRLVDLDSHLYQVPLEQAIAAVESLGLRERRVYLDPSLSDEQRAGIETLTGRQVLRRRRKDRLFQTMGYIGLILLLFNLFFLSLP